MINVIETIIVINSFRMVAEQLNALLNGKLTVKCFPKMYEEEIVANNV